MITRQGARKALRLRAGYVPKTLELDSRFSKQNEFVNDPSRYIVAQCSRRAGKSNGLAIRFFKTLEKYPGCQCVYLSLTFDSARDILWPVLHELNDQYSLGCTFTESKLWMTHPNGSSLKLMGADMRNFIKRLKGRKYPGVAIDEAQDFGIHLQSLVDDVLTPSISDYADGWIALTGTPGPVPQGYFFNITQGRKFGYSFHEWTLLDNPFMPEPGKFIEDLKRRREWKNDNPTLLREWQNKWVLDVQSLWIQYSESINHFDRLPNLKYEYIMGIDLGYKDADAIAVIAWSENDPVTYLVEELITVKQGITELSQQIEGMSRKYPISKMVMDEGALGKKIGEELRRQKGLPIYGADKMRKQENVEFLNDALRTGRFKAHKNSRFTQDSYLVQIDWDKSTPDRIVVKKNPHSDIIDSVLYAFKESPAFSYQAPAVLPKPGTPGWAQKQRDDMWEAAQDHFQKQAELESRYNGSGFDD